MKLAKRLISLVLCLLLVSSLAVTAFATSETSGTTTPTFTLTVNNAAPDHIYEAYQIFAGTLGTVNEVPILSDIVWGSAIVNDSYDISAAVLAAINAEANLAVLHGATNAEELSKKLADVTSDSGTLDLFAQIVGNCMTGTSVPAGTSGAQANNQYTITGLPAGYYLVKDQDNTLQGANDVHSKYIIRVLNSVEVTPKSDVPKVEKTINDTLDGSYTEIEDFDINDTAYFKWQGTLPSNLNSYETYYYKFTDTMPTGLDYLEIQQIYLEGHEGNKVHIFYDITDADTANDTLPQGIVVSNSGKVLTVEFNNLLTLYPNILATQKVIVKYTARVTRDALVAEPMTNSVKLEFSNNPNGGGHGETPEDVAHAFTFEINVDKYDIDNPSKKLEGAEFVLFYERTENDATVKYYAKVITEELIDANTVINGTQVDADDLGVVYEWTTNKEEASILDTDVNGALTVTGLDEGIYYLEETKAPAGYNLMESPVQIKIAPTYTDGTETTVSVSYEVDSIAQSSNTVGVRNSSGATLPSTGGIGTTLFYVVGSILFVAAVVLLITKKRMRE